MKKNNISIPIIIALVIAVISLGVALAAFSTTLIISGNGTVEATNWSIVFEGTTSTSVIDAPTIVGSATEVTHPTLGNNDTSIGTYSVTLTTPGDSITYKFKIHNKGSYAGDISALTISGVSNPSTAISGASLVTDSSIAQANANTLANVEYKFYYEDDNTLVGQNAIRDCLAPGESENVVLRIVFSASDDPSVLPSSNLTLDNLGINMTYTQASSCASQSGGNSGGNSSAVNTNPTLDVSHAGGSATIETAPTITGDTLSGGVVSFTNPGDEVSFVVDIIPDNNSELYYPIPTKADFVNSNPNLNSDLFDDIDVVITDADTGETIDANDPVCVETNAPIRIKMTLKYKDVPTNNVINGTKTNVNVPSTSLVSRAAITCYNSTPAGQYLVRANSSWTWSSSLPVVHPYSGNDYTPDIYIKKANNVVYSCIVINSREYCINGFTSESTIQKYCNVVGGYYYHGNVEYWSGDANDCYITDNENTVIYNFWSSPGYYDYSTEEWVDAPTGFVEVEQNGGYLECEVSHSDNSYWCTY